MHVDGLRIEFDASENTISLSSGNKRVFTLTLGEARGMLGLEFTRQLIRGG